MAQDESGKIMAPAGNDYHRRPSSTRKGKILVRAAVVVLSIVGLTFAGHGVYRVWQISQSKEPETPTESRTNAKPVPPVHETGPLPTESRMAVPSALPEQETGQPPGTAIPSESQPFQPVPQAASETLPDVVPADTESPSLGWSAEPPPPEASPEFRPDSLNTEVINFLTAWKTAWENTAGPNKDKEMAAYMQFYSSDFQARQMGRAAWKQDKQEKNRKKRWIKVTLNDITIKEPARRDFIEATFFQEYGSSNYSSAALKTLILRREETGWKIIGIRE